MRYNDPTHLETWKRSGRYPRIHDDLYRLLCEEALGTRFLDLGCSTGLLAERLQRSVKGAVVLGVDADVAAIAAGTEAGLTVPREVLAVTPDTLETLGERIRTEGLTVLVARRCLPEILGAESAFALAFTQSLLQAGIEEIFVQGRAYSPQAKHALSQVEAEIQALASGYQVRVRRGECAYLVRQESVAAKEGNQNA